MDVPLLIQATEHLPALFTAQSSGAALGSGLQAQSPPSGRRRAAGGAAGKRHTAKLSSGPNSGEADELAGQAQGAVCLVQWAIRALDRAPGWEAIPRAAAFQLGRAAALGLHAVPILASLLLRLGMSAPATLSCSFMDLAVALAMAWGQLAEHRSPAAEGFKAAYLAVVREPLLVSLLERSRQCLELVEQADSSDGTSRSRRFARWVQGRAGQRPCVGCPAASPKKLGRQACTRWAPGQRALPGCRAPHSAVPDPDWFSLQCLVYIDPLLPCVPPTHLLQAQQTKSAPFHVGWAEEWPSAWVTDNTWRWACGPWPSSCPRGLGQVGPPFVACWRLTTCGRASSPGMSPRKSPLGRGLAASGWRAASSRLACTSRHAWPGMILARPGWELDTGDGSAECAIFLPGC